MQCLLFAFHCISLHSMIFSHMVVARASQFHCNFVAMPLEFHYIWSPCLYTPLQGHYRSLPSWRSKALLVGPQTIQCFAFAFHVILNDKTGNVRRPILCLAFGQAMTRLPSHFISLQSWPCQVSLLLAVAKPWTAAFFTRHYMSLHICTCHYIPVKLHYIFIQRITASLQLHCNFIAASLHLHKMLAM